MKATNILHIPGNERIKSAPLYHNGRFSASLIIMEQGYQIPPHTSPSDAMILVLEGKIAFMLREEVTVLENGHLFTFPANELHALQALEKSRFLLIR